MIAMPLRGKWFNLNHPYAGAGAERQFRFDSSGILGHEPAGFSRRCFWQGGVLLRARHSSAERRRGWISAIECQDWTGSKFNPGQTTCCDMLRLFSRNALKLQGYGDVLAGTLGTLLAWSRNKVVEGGPLW